MNAFNSSFTRREVLGAGTAMGLGLAGCGTLIRASPDPASGCVDAHTHVWTPDVQRYPLAKGKTVGELKPRSFTAEEFLAIARPEGVTRAVLIAHGPYYADDNRYMIDCTRRHSGVFSIVGSIDERKPDLRERMVHLKSQGVVAYRILPDKYADRTPIKNPRRWLEAEAMGRFWKHAADLGIAMCPLIQTHHLETIGPMCKRHPQTTCVLDHFGRVDVGQEKELRQLLDLARYPNVHVKISAFYARGKHKPPHTELIPKIRRCLEAFGPDRLMWASDCPYQLLGGNTYRDSIALIRDQMNLGADAKDALLRRTANRIFFS